MPEPVEFPVKPGTPISDALIRGAKAFAREDATDGDAAYREAVRLVPAGNPALWSALVTDHVAQLHELGRPTVALERCNEYLFNAEAWCLETTIVSLRLLRAEICLSIGDRPGVEADLAVIHGRADFLTMHERAVVHRLEGLSAAAQGYHDKAERHLREAERIFGEIGSQDGVDVIHRDRRRIAVQHGNEGAVSDELDGPPPQTVTDHLLRAQALRRRQRYEEAIGVLEDARALDLDAALRFPVIHELVVLLRLIADDKAADRLLPLLREAAALSSDPAASAETVYRVSGTGAPYDEVDTTFDQVLQRARRLITDGRVDEAMRLIVELRPRAKLDHEVAAWHLAAGELELAQGDVTEAVAHLRAAADHASPAWLVEVRIRALRLLGRAHYQLSAGDRAAVCWAEAHRLEEQIAWRQPTDAVRIRMLHAVPDEHDERVRAAAAELQQRGPEAAAAVVVAMEAARGAAILGRILPNNAALARDLPSPNDQRGAWQWVKRMADGFPRSQVAWLLHSTPDHVHHAVIGRDLLYHASIPCVRDELESAINWLTACWEHPAFLEASVKWGEFDEFLAKLASRIGLNTVIPLLPSHVERIAVAAGGALSELPFAAMTVPGDTEPIGLRYALSDLPCLSARRPLNRRSLRLRGDKRLLVSPPTGLTTAARTRADTVLEDEQATPTALQAALELHRYRQVRIDTHGQHDPADPEKSWLQLAPDGPDGRLDADELQSMDLRGCGTLVLGACESGMAKRIGRDERLASSGLPSMRAPRR
jgi:tetratricopeptide (TPR) repeat protein